MPNRAQIESVLRSDMDRAVERAAAAARRLREVTSDIPSGIPSPDGALRIRQAGTDHQVALEHLRNALDRWTAFVVHSTIPDDL